LVITESLRAEEYDHSIHGAHGTDDYVFSQLIPYIGNKRKLLGLIGEAIEQTGTERGTFVDLFTGSTSVARFAKSIGFRVLANDWEPYAYQIARGTVSINREPHFAALGGAGAAFAKLNDADPLEGYFTKHLCPADDEHPDPSKERMFFTRANGQRIDAMGELVQSWHRQGLIDDDELAFVLSAMAYSVSYVSNTSGVFKGFHAGWGGSNGTALHRILSRIELRRPVLFDNAQENIAIRQDAVELGARLSEYAGGMPDIVYIDPPYNQHPYGSNYHVLNTLVLWDKPPLNVEILVDGKKTNKSAIRTDWRTERRSPFNHANQAQAAFEHMIDSVEGRHLLISYSTEGNVPLEFFLNTLAARGSLSIVAKQYKRYRVSPTRPSAKPRNTEFVAIVDTSASGRPHEAEQAAKELRGIETGEQAVLFG
jgi:adenine-specific DNA-methyltransferase